MSVNIENKIRTVFNEVQKNTGSHWRYYQVLAKLYTKISFAEFAQAFQSCLRFTFQFDIKNTYVQTCLKFVANFIINQNNNGTLNSDVSYDSHPLLHYIVSNVLELSNHKKYQVRNHVCTFVAMILECIRSNDHVDNNICNYIQDVMIERLLTDNKSVIRSKAITTLYRLQDLQNSECPVIKAFLHSLHDSSSDVRKSVVEKIAPSNQTLPRIIKALQDIEEKVRCSAFRKCAALPPSVLKTAERREVCLRGLDEPSKSVKKIFTDILLPKWLGHYAGDYLKFLKAIKLDPVNMLDVADDTSEMCFNIMQEIFKRSSENSMISIFPLNEDKLIPSMTLSTEMVLYWRAMQWHFINKDSSSDFLDQILPELTPFCSYIEKIMEERELIANTSSECEYSENQFIIKHLFEIAGNFDLGDEVGRLKLHNLVRKVLTDFYVNSFVISTLIKLLEKFNSDSNSLIEEVYELLITIEEAKYLPSKEELKKRSIKINALETEMNTLSELVDKHIKNKEFAIACDIGNEINNLKLLINRIPNEYITPMKEYYCLNKSLNMIISLLGLESVDTINSTLKLIQRSYLDTVHTQDLAIYRKVFKCFALYSVINLDSAKEFLKLIYTPVVCYRSSSSNDKEIVCDAVSTISDLLTLYGPELFRDQKVDYDYNENTDFPVVHYVIDIIMEMIDDKHHKLRELAGLAIAKILSEGKMVDRNLFSKIVLKFHDPMLGENNPKSVQLFGIAINEYIQHVDGNELVVIESVTDTLQMCSPASGIDVNNLIKYLCAITQINKRRGVINMHEALCVKICTNIIENAVRNVPLSLFVQMLVTLTLPNKLEDLTILKSNLEKIIRQTVLVPIKTKLKRLLLKVIGKLDKFESLDNSDNNSTDDETQWKQNESTVIIEASSPESDNRTSDFNSHSIKTISSVLKEEESPLRSLNSTPSDIMVHGCASDALIAVEESKSHLGESAESCGSVIEGSPICSNNSTLIEGESLFGPHESTSSDVMVERSPTLDDSMTTSLKRKISRKCILANSDNDDSELSDCSSSNSYISIYTGDNAAKKTRRDFSTEIIVPQDDLSQTNGKRSNDSDTVSPLKRVKTEFQN